MDIDGPFSSDLSFRVQLVFLGCVARKPVSLGLGSVGSKIILRNKPGCGPACLCQFFL